MTRELNRDDDISSFWSLPAKPDRLLELSKLRKQALSWFAVLAFLFGGPDLRAIGLVWPTPNPSWLEGRALEDFVQPAASGRTESALFGCTRTGGTRFHEGIDLKPLQRDRRGEALDAVFAVMGGRVLHANRTPWHSSYGNYVVIEHTAVSPRVISLYAHLASIDDAVVAGRTVVSGQRIGVMGRSAGGYTIPAARAHLHFELGLWLSEAFQDWYDSMNYESPNRHGVMSGFNIVGFDPLDFYDRYRAGEVRDFSDYLRREPVAFTVRVASERVPDFVIRYPVLLEGDLPEMGVSGWEIDFTWYGLPKRWRPLAGEIDSPGGSFPVKVVSFDADIVAANTCRPTVSVSGGTPRIGSHTERVLRILFALYE